MKDEESIILPQLKQGDYAWRLNSLYEDTEHIFIGSFKFFSIGYPELAEILWNFSDQKTAQFFANQPEVNLAWKIKNR